MLLGPYDHAVDYWTLGINAFCMLSGEYPFCSHENEGIGLTIQKSIVNDPLPGINEILKKKHPKMQDISEAACDFVKMLLNKNPEERLGSRNNHQNIKEHPFFNEINWNQLENGELPPPIKPNVCSSNL